MKKKPVLLLTSAVALVLEALPYGAVLNFANPEGEPFRQSFSYFDPTPFGYANFAPLLTAMLTCLLLILIAVSCFAKRPMGKPISTVAILAAILSVCPILYGIQAFSLVGGLISLSLVLTAGISLFQSKTEDV